MHNVIVKLMNLNYILWTLEKQDKAWERFYACYVEGAVNYVRLIRSTYILKVIDKPEFLFKQIQNWSSSILSSNYVKYGTKILLET